MIKTKIPPWGSEAAMLCCFRDMLRAWGALCYGECAGHDMLVVVTDEFMKRCEASSETPASATPPWSAWMTFTTAPGVWRARPTLSTMTIGAAGIGMSLTTRQWPRPMIPRDIPRQRVTLGNGRTWARTGLGVTRAVEDHVRVRAVGTFPTRWGLLPTGLLMRAEEHHET